MHNQEMCLKVVNLTKEYGGLRALNNVTFTISMGTRSAIIGPNGAGKTTLLNLIGGQDAPTEGQVLYRGRDITRLPSYRRTQLGLARVFQITTLFPRLTVLENFVIAVQGVSHTKYIAWRPFKRCSQDVAAARSLIERVGLKGHENTPVSALSYGERRQLELGMALASDPKLLLLDEPTAGLARGEARQMVGMLQQLPSDITIVFIEHDMDVAFELAEIITVLHEGRIITQGTPDEIRRDRTVQQIYLGEAI